MLDERRNKIPITSKKYWKVVYREMDGWAGILYVLFWVVGLVCYVRVYSNM